MQPWHGTSWDGHEEMMAMMMIGWIVIAVLVIAVVVRMFSRIPPQGGEDRDRRERREEPSAEEIVKQRYARRELTSEQLERTLADLRR